MDNHTPEQRSYNMSQIRSKNTKPELFVFKELESRGIMFDAHYNLPGKPDIAFPDKRVAVFINGEFWHGRNFKKLSHGYSEYWYEKIEKNMKRDRRNYKLLRQDGWTVMRIWDKDLKKHARREINKILRAINE